MFVSVFCLFVIRDSLLKIDDSESPVTNH